MSVIADIGGAIAGSTALVIGLVTAVRGSRASKAKKLADDKKAERDILYKKEERLDTITQDQMTRLVTKVETLETALDRERNDRIRESERFFLAINSFRTRDWRWSELYHQMAGTLRANNLPVPPLPDILEAIPAVVDQFLQDGIINPRVAAAAAAAVVAADAVPPLDHR